MARSFLPKPADKDSLSVHSPEVWCSFKPPTQGYLVGLDHVLKKATLPDMDQCRTLCCGEPRCRSAFMRRGVCHLSNSTKMEAGLEWRSTPGTEYAERAPPAPAKNSANGTVVTSSRTTTTTLPVYFGDAVAGYLSDQHGSRAILKTLEKSNLQDCKKACFEALPQCLAIQLLKNYHGSTKRCSLLRMTRRFDEASLTVTKEQHRRGTHDVPGGTRPGASSSTKSGHTASTDDEVPSAIPARSSKIEGRRTSVPKDVVKHLPAVPAAGVHLRPSPLRAAKSSLEVLSQTAGKHMKPKPLYTNSPDAQYFEMARSAPQQSLLDPPPPVDNRTGIPGRATDDMFYGPWVSHCDSDFFASTLHPDEGYFVDYELQLCRKIDKDDVSNVVAAFGISQIVSAFWADRTSFKRVTRLPTTLNSTLVYDTCPGGPDPGGAMAHAMSSPQGAKLALCNVAYFAAHYLQPGDALYYTKEHGDEVCYRIPQSHVASAKKLCTQHKLALLGQDQDWESRFLAIPGRMTDAYSDVYGEVKTPNCDRKLFEPTVPKGAGYFYDARKKTCRLIGVEWISQVREAAKPNRTNELVWMDVYSKNLVTYLPSEVPVDAPYSGFAGVVGDRSLMGKTINSCDIQKFMARLRPGVGFHYDSIKETCERIPEDKIPIVRACAMGNDAKLCPKVKGKLCDSKRPGWRECKSKTSTTHLPWETSQATGKSEDPTTKSLGWTAPRPWNPMGVTYFHSGKIPFPPLKPRPVKMPDPAPPGDCKYVKALKGYIKGDKDDSNFALEMYPKIAQTPAEALDRCKTVGKRRGKCVVHVGQQQLLVPIFLSSSSTCTSFFCRFCGLPVRVHLQFRNSTTTRIAIIFPPPRP